MTFTGRLISLEKDYNTNRWQIVLTVNEKAALEPLNELIKAEKVTAEIKRYRNQRSLDANKLLWRCITDIAYTLNLDKWEVYLNELKAHGKSFPVSIVKEGLDALKATWREVEVVGEWVDENGIERVTALCYVGSHLYNTKEFAQLLNDVMQDMKELGLQPPTSEEMRRSLELWEKHTVR